MAIGRQWTGPSWSSKEKEGRMRDILEAPRFPITMNFKLRTKRTEQAKRVMCAPDAGEEVSAHIKK